MLIGGRAHSVEDAEFIGKAGFPFAEISILNQKAFLEHALRPLRAIRDNYGIFYLAHGPEEGNAWEPDILRRDFLPQIIGVLDCLQQLSISLLTVHFWMDTRFLSRNILEQKIDILQEMAAFAADRGITLCLENLSEHFADFRPVFEAVEGLGMTLDIGHGELLTDRNTAYEFSRNCLERVQHIHIHDNKGGNAPADDLHLPLGEGVIDFRPILQDLQQRGFDKTITLEVKADYLLNGKKKIEQIWNR